MTALRQVERLDVGAMLTGYVLVVVVAWLYARSCRAGVLKDSEICRLRQQVDGHRLTVDGLDGQVAALEAERDEAIRQWTGWFKRAMEAETERDQGRTTLGRVHCRATAGTGAP